LAGTGHSQKTSDQSSTQPVHSVPCQQPANCRNFKLPLTLARRWPRMRSGLHPRLSAGPGWPLSSRARSQMFSSPRASVDLGLCSWQPGELELGKRAEWPILSCSPEPRRHGALRLAREQHQLHSAPIADQGKMTLFRVILPLRRSTSTYSKTVPRSHSSTTLRKTKQTQSIPLSKTISSPILRKCLEMLAADKAVGWWHTHTMGSRYGGE
jgi:hypothetical protein